MASEGEERYSVLALKRLWKVATGWLGFLLSPVQQQPRHPTRNHKFLARIILVSIRLILSNTARQHTFGTRTLAVDMNNVADTMSIRNALIDNDLKLPNEDADNTNDYLISIWTIRKLVSQSFNKRARQLM